MGHNIKVEQNQMLHLSDGTPGSWFTFNSRDTVSCSASDMAVVSTSAIFSLLKVGSGTQKGQTDKEMWTTVHPIKEQLFTTKCPDVASYLWSQGRNITTGYVLLRFRLLLCSPRFIFRPDCGNIKSKSSNAVTTVTNVADRRSLANNSDFEQVESLNLTKL